MPRFVRDRRPDPLLTSAMDHWYAKENVVGLAVGPLRGATTDIATALGALCSEDAGERQEGSAAARRALEAFDPVLETLWRVGVPIAPQRETVVLHPFPGWVALDARHLGAMRELVHRLAAHFDHPALRPGEHGPVHCLDRWLLPLAPALVGGDDQLPSATRLRTGPPWPSDSHRRSVLDRDGEQLGIVTEVAPCDGIGPARYWVAHNPTAEPWRARWRAEGTPSIEVALLAFEAHLDGRLDLGSARVREERSR